MPKTIRLHVTHYFIMKIPNKRELQQIACNRFSDMKLYKDYTNEPYSFLVNDTILLSDNLLRFKKNLLQKQLLVRKSNQSITKSSKTRLNTN